MATNQSSRIFSHRLLRALKKSMLIAAIVACLLPQSLLAAVTSNVTGGVLTVSSDAGDSITVTCDTLQVQVNGADPGSGAALCATITEIAVTGGPDPNTIDLNTVNTTDFTTLVTVTVDGAGDSDVITGTFLADTLNGGDGNDRVVGHRGADVMNGNGDDDTMVWNPGDGSDVADGGDGNDTMEVNGGITETFTISATESSVRFDRVTPAPFTVEIITTTENLVLNANAGPDTITGTTGLDGLILMTLNGGDGDDFITGGDGDDTLNGDGGDDLLVGFRGADTMNGGADDDVMVWNPGDGSDIANGGDGLDIMVVNGGNATETFTISGTVTSTRFDRVNPAPFSVDILTTTEELELNANGGGDIVTGTVGLSGKITLTLNGGDGNDFITGGDGDDTLNGDGGDDLLVGFRGADTMNGGADNDVMVWNPGDGSDVSDGGDGADVMVVNGGGVSETFTISATATGTLFDRVNPAPFSVDILTTTEELELNGNGGGDIVTGTVGLSGKITLTLNGGDGNDLIKGGDGPDTLNGDNGDDTLIGFRGADVMNGGPDNDTMIWNNGDGSDIMDGGDGDDVAIANGGTVSETFAITPAAAVAGAGLNAPLVGSTFFQRVTPAPFSLDIEAEGFELNGNDGSDLFNVTPLISTTVDYDGGSAPVADQMIVDAQNLTVTVLLNAITVAGRQPVTSENVEIVEIINDPLPVKLYLPYSAWERIVP